MKTNGTMLGIDPGFGVTGFGIIKHEQGKLVLLDYGFLKMNPAKSLSERVKLFHDFFKDKIIIHSVTAIALETSFLGKNAQSFLKLGYLRGTLYLLAAQHNALLHEFSPSEVKQSLTGFGGASKEQVAHMMLRLFPRLQVPEKLDVTDALAITLCGVWQSNSLLAYLAKGDSI
jgi:crossover junction endodeoxyribonuclease RuvC